MKKTIVVLAVSVCLSGVAWADDFNRPGWYDDGNPTNTRQAWEFETNCGSLFAPEEVDNPFGTPCAAIGGPNAHWLEAFQGGPFGLRTGILSASVDGDYIEFNIPNEEDLTKYKEVVVLLTVATDNPDFVTESATTLTPSYSTGSGVAYRTCEPIVTTAADGWYYIEDHWIIDPQPECESYKLELKDPEWTDGCTLWMDEAVIYTRCVPEPATMSLLAVGALALARRRR
ncbi:MAG: PEP-CTERM sorting domain-containing protein [Phycisphaerae bacterium]|nr:PEP-CTERM sorting domain-containing protein [Phycisphaerae bacterium]